MDDIARLRIHVQDDGTPKATSGLRGLTNQADKAERATTRLRNSFNTGMKVMAGAAVGATAALTALWKIQSASIDATAKHADSIGVSTEALTQFRHAAELTGLGADALDTSLQRLVRRTNDAANGNEGLREAYAALNVEVDSLAQMNPEQQMYVMADAFAQVEDRGERTRLAFQLFGREGIKMVNMFEDGSEGLRQMAEDADRLGLTLNRVDAAKVEAANDALYRAGAISEAFGRTVAVELGPIIGALADAFADATAEAGGMQEVVMGFIDVGAKGISYLVDAWRGWEIILKSGQVAVQYLKIGFMDFVNYIASTMPMVGQAIVNGITLPIRTALQGLSYLSDTAADALAWLEKATQVGPITAFDPKTMNDARMELGELQWQLNQLANQPLASDQVDEWLANVRQAANEAAEAVAASRRGFSFTGGEYDASGGKEDTSGAEALEQVRRHLLSEEESIQESYDRRRQIILENTEANSAAQRELLDRLDAQFGSDALAGLGGPPEDELTRINDFYARRRELILENSALTEEQRTQLELELTRQRNDAIAALEQERVSMLMQQSGMMFGGLADLAKTFAGEQSGLYKVMFATSKAFALADSIVKIQQGIAGAAAVPFPGNIPAMASVAAATAGIVSTIAGTNYAGAYDKGGNIPAGQVGIVGEYGPELVRGPANVTGREDTASLLQQIVAGQQANGGQQAASPTNIRIINAVDPEVMGEYLGSTEGEKVIMNILKRNTRTLKGMVA